MPSAKIPKARDSPAEQKLPSKKEEGGIVETAVQKAKELWDWWESKGTITREKQPTVQKPEGRSPAIVKDVKKEKQSTCVCKQYDLVWGKFFNCQERKKIIEISRRLMCDPNHLTSAMALETGGKFDPSIVNSLGYTGLIQIGALAAEDINKRKGTRITAGKNGNLKNMDKLEQLTYVEYYLEPFRGRLNTLADFYLAILMPVDVGW